MFRLFGQILLLWCMSVTTALACSCLPPDITYSYNNHDQAFVGRVLGTFTRGNYRIFDVSVRKAIKGCQASGDVVRVATSRSSATCGTNFQIGESYVIFANESLIGGQTRLVTNMCAGNTLVSQVSPEDRDYLLTRENCCGGTCECVDGSQPLQCFVDPCSVTPACGAADTCEANYCGGCTAEFYDADGYGVCTPW